MEEAHFYRMQMEGEGRQACVLDESVAALWGPLAVGGVRVLVLEPDASEADRPKPPRSGVGPKEQILWLATFVVVLVMIWPVRPIIEVDLFFFGLVAGFFYIVLPVLGILASRCFNSRRRTVGQVVLAMIFGVSYFLLGGPVG